MLILGPVDTTAALRLQSEEKDDFSVVLSCKPVAYLALSHYTSLTQWVLAIAQLICLAHGAPFYTIVKKRCCALGITFFSLLVLMLFP